MNSKQTISLLLATALLGATSTSVFAGDKGAKEKCYGVVKAGKNDCQTKTSSCAGTSTKDDQADAFVVVPAGLCDRLANGSADTPRS